MASGQLLPSPMGVRDFDAESTVCASVFSGGSPTSVTSGSSPTKETSIEGSYEPAGTRSPSGAESRFSCGWPGLAHEMIKRPQFEAFPRFRELNIKNLLYYQIEIAKWEKELKTIEVEDYKGPRPGRDYAKSADKMLFPGDSTRTEPRQRRVVYEIRRLLKEYNEALLQHAKVTELPFPDKCSIETLRVELGSGYAKAINGDGAHAWGNPADPQVEEKLTWKKVWCLVRSLLWRSEPEADGKDLATVHRPKHLDGLTQWVKQEWIPFWHYHLSQYVCCWRRTRDRNHDGTISYSVQWMLRFTSAVATLVACVLPTVAIGILTTANTTIQKLGYIGGFTVIFAIGLMLFSEPGTPRSHIFTATATFSAVLVVFVQNQ